MVPSISLVLLAGGLASRLQPLTEKMPKAMLEVAGEPFISHQLRLFKREGLQDIVICAGHLGNQIEEYVGDGSKFGLKVRYSLDGSALLGTGGAISNALPMLEDQFWVMYGDSFLNISFQPILEYYFSQGCSGLMTVLLNKNQWDKSNVIFRDDRIVKYSKAGIASGMNYIDYGLGILNKSAFSLWKLGGKFDLASVYCELVSKGELAGYEVAQRFYEIGSLSGLEETREYVKHFNLDSTP
ncbi:MAG: NTP transferase domain-containing protein [Nitrospinaceae bacterium]|jgi:N-acetyl-alpha-D-muramate 1-phosphate uridylyltransferase|nr:NTP transferase domain-containing protein [Nitrospinaceae bacterium]